MSWFESFPKAPPAMSMTSTLTRSASETVVALAPAVHEERVVRFNDECILIPESRPRRPRLLSKSYSLPLWKKKPQSSASDSDPDDGSNAGFKVPMPRSVPYINSYQFFILLSERCAASWANLALRVEVVILLCSHALSIVNPRHPCPPRRVLQVEEHTCDAHPCLHDMI